MKADNFFKLAGYDHAELFNGTEYVWEALARLGAYLERLLRGRNTVCKARIEGPVSISGPVYIGDGTGAHAAGLGGSCRSITENIARIVERTKSKIWNRFAGIVTEPFIAWSAPSDSPKVLEMVVFTNLSIGVLSDKTLIRDLAQLILANDHFARDGAGRLYRYDSGVYADGGDLYVKR